MQGIVEQLSHVSHFHDFPCIHDCNPAAHFSYDAKVMSDKNHREPGLLLKFVITSEVGPPKGINMDACLDEAKHFGEKVTAINVTDIQSAVMRVRSLATCI